MIEIEAFDYLDDPPEVIPPEIVSGKKFGPDDVEKIEYSWFDSVDVGEYDDTRYWLVVGKLKDGRWFHLDVMADGSEWITSGYASVSDSLENIIKYSLSDEDRKNLGITLNL